MKMLSLESNVDLVLMDIRMPVMDGIEATYQALKKHPNLKILAISIHTQGEKIQQMVDASVVGFLAKGGDKSGIKEAVTRVLKGETYFNNYANNN